MQNAERRDFGGWERESAAGGEALFFSRECLAKNRVRSGRCGLAHRSGKQSADPKAQQWLWVVCLHGGKCAMGTVLW